MICGLIRKKQKGLMKMTFAEWVRAYNGKAIDWDGVSPYQCVDEIKCYVQMVFGIQTKGKGVSAWGNAKDYFLDFDNKNWGGYKKFHDAGFVRIKNTPSFIPMKGDIVVWNNGAYGHIGVATGEGDTKDFYSYDQNWGGKYMHKVKHTYSFFLGVLRPPRRIRADVNIRKGAGIKYAKVGEYKKGAKVVVYSVTNGWAKVGENRYISANYIEEI